MKTLMEVLISNGKNFVNHTAAHVFEKKRGRFFWSEGKSEDNFYAIGYKSSSELTAMHGAVRYAIDLAKRIGFKFVIVAYSTGEKATWACVDELFDRWDVVEREGVV